MNNLILITGSNGGIGSKLAEYLIKNGLRNIVCQYHRSNENIKQILESNDFSTQKHLFKADLTNEEDVKNLNLNIQEKLETEVSSIINVAGGSTNCVSWKMKTEDFKNIVDMNLLSTFLSCREFIPGMRKNNYGRIINVSSVVAFTGVAGASHYCAAKAGIVGFSKALSLELINKNITVNTLALGYFNTGIIDEVPAKIQEVIKESIPVKRFGTTEEIGGLVKYLLSSEANYATGQVHHLNGGLF